MPDHDELTPADPNDVVTAPSLGLTAKPPLARYQAAETMAKIVAERLVEHLERSGFVIMRKPVAGPAAIRGEDSRPLGSKAAGRGQRRCNPVSMNTTVMA